MSKRPTIGLLTRGVSNEIGASFLAGVSDVVRARDVNLITFAGGSLRFPHGFEAQGNILYEMVDPEIIDGLLLDSGDLSHYVGVETLQSFCQRYGNLPIVSIEVPIDGIPTVLVDFYEGMRGVITHLVEAHGYRRIAFIRGPVESLTAQERYRAYVDVLAERGLPLDLSLVVFGTFHPPSGEQAVRVLLDERQVEFEALAAANDFMAVDALRALQARGIRVPDDMAVVGFDNLDITRVVDPPLTTARLHNYERAKQGTELLLAQLAGQKVARRTIIPAELVVRHSCGCPSPALVQAAVGAVTRLKEPVEAVLARDSTVTEMANAISPTNVPWGRGQAKQLLDSFADELGYKRSGHFLDILGKILRQTTIEGEDIGRWHSVLSVLRRLSLPHLGDEDARSWAEDLWQQARVMIGEAAEREQARRRLEIEQQVRAISEIGQGLIATLEVESFGQVLEQKLPRLGIPGYYLSLYEDWDDPTTLARLVVAYNETGRIELDPPARSFPTCQLLPFGIWPYHKRFSMIVIPLYFRQDQLGFILLELGRQQSMMMFDVLQGQLSSALKGASLLQERKQAEAALEIAYSQVEKQVEERTAALKREFDERRRAEAEIKRRNRELALLNQVITASASGHTQEAILEIACRELVFTFDVPRATALLLNEEKTMATITAQYLADGSDSIVDQTIPLNRSLVQSLLTHKTPLVIEHVQKDTRLEPIHNLLQQRGVTSLLSLPIFIDDEGVGAIILSSTLEPFTFAADVINLAWSVTNQVAGALARSRLVQTHQRLSTAIEQSAENVIITDTDSSILYVNPAFERTTGYSRSEVIGRRMNVLKSGRHNNNFYRELWRTISSGRVWRGRFVNKRKDGTFFTEESTISPVLDENGSIINYVRVSRDVTRELQLEEQLHQALKMDAIGQLAGGVAHDFNNMLTAIMGYAGLALELLPPDHQAYDDIHGIQKTAERAATLTRQLLAFARRQIAQPRVINLNESILDMDKMLRRLIGADIELVTLPSQNLGLVKIDAGQFEQVLVNLAVNARDAMPDGGKLVIETANVTIDQHDPLLYADMSPGSYVMVSVSDNGIGMSEAVKKHIFEPFFTTKGVGEGTGLGLATCFGLVKQSGGHIWVDSEPDQGTTFRVYLPQVEENTPFLAFHHKTSLLPGGTETILLVEDEPSVRELTARVLRQQGYTVFEATNGDEALRLAQEQVQGKIHLLLTDLVMPQMGGKALARRLLSVQPTLKVLFISGYTDSPVINDDIITATTAFLQKPFTPEQLAHKVRGILNLRTGTE